MLPAAIPMITVVPIPSPTPFPVGAVNSYLLPGEPVTLVDTGLKTPEARAAIESGIRAAGLSLASVRRIILTHGHLDHFGLAASLAAQTGATIYAHPDDGPKYHVDAQVITHYLAHLRQSGAPAALGSMLLEVFRGYRRLVDPIPAFEPLHDGDALAIAGGSLRVLHTPGHSAGHICLAVQDTGAQTPVLLAGDILLEEISPNPVLDIAPDGARVPSLPPLLRSLRRLMALGEVPVYPGHGGPFMNTDVRISALLEHHAARADEVYRLLDEHPRTAFDLAQAMFPQVEGIDVMLAVSEIIGHLDLLVAEGRAEAQPDGELIGYRRGTGVPPRSSDE